MECLEKFQISVVMPLFNGEKYVYEAILSLLNQTILPLEIIVIDDCSTDLSYEIVKGLSSENNLIKLYKQTSNKGVSATRNYGISITKGNWIMFLDADDIVKPNLIQSNLELIKRFNQKSDENWVLIYSAIEQINSCGEVLNSIQSVQRNCREIFGYEIVRNEIISPSGVMVNKQTLINVGGFNEKIKYSEDWDLWLRIAQAGGFVYNEKPLIKIRRHNENASKKIKVMLQAEIDILEKYDLQIIEEAIYMRNISVEQNILDYVSILYRLDKWDLGNLKLNDLLKYNEKNASVHFYKGLYFLKTNQLNKAKACFQTVIRLQPQNGASLNNLAAILAIEQEFTLANKLLYKAISYYEGYIDAQKNIEKLNLFSKGGKITLDDLRFTWRELRPTLLRYSE